MYQPSHYQKLFEETSLDLLAADKPIRVDFCCSSAHELQLVQTTTRFGHGETEMRCLKSDQFAEIFRLEDVTKRQKTICFSNLIFMCSSLPAQVSIFKHSGS